MKTAVIATLIASAAAFAPAKQAVTSSALKAFESELGAQAPLGFFDPLGLVADGDQEKFDRLRLVEIKHGRIAMLGVVGYLVTYAGTLRQYCRVVGEVMGSSISSIPPSCSLATPLTLSQNRHSFPRCRGHSCWICRT